MAKAWFNGALVETNAPALPLTDRGLTLGEGLFETMKVKGGRILRFDSHMARLAMTADVLGITLPLKADEIFDAVQATMAANDLSDAVARLTVTGGSGPRGLMPPTDQNPTALVTVAPLPGALPPVRAVISQLTRRNEFSPLSNLKTTNYLDNVLARREADQRGTDEAILLNTAGRVAEATIANIFVLVDGALLTPPLKDGVLPGVMRAHIIGTFRGEEAEMTPDVFQMASEAFLTNALGVRPLVEVDGQPVGDGQPGLITQMLMSRL